MRYTDEASRVNKAARLLNPIAAAAVVLLVFVQVYLIAEYVFGDVGALKTHEAIGKVVLVVELIVAITAVLGWWRDRLQVGLSAALFVVGLVQVSLATTHLGSSPSVRALHGMLAIAVVLLAATVLARSWRVVFPTLARE
jgi:hypothetical protein